MLQRSVTHMCHLYHCHAHRSLRCSCLFCLFDAGKCTCPLSFWNRAQAMRRSALPFPILVSERPPLALRCPWIGSTRVSCRTVRLAYIVLPAANVFNSALLCFGPSSLAPRLVPKSRYHPRVMRVRTRADSQHSRSCVCSNWSISVLIHRFGAWSQPTQQLARTISIGVVCPGSVPRLQPVPPCPVHESPMCWRRPVLLDRRWTVVPRGIAGETRRSS